MEKKYVVILDEWVDFKDSWRDLFLSALERRAYIRLTKFFSDFFYFDDKLDVLIYLKRKEENESFEDILSNFAQQLDAKLIALGYNIPKEEIITGFITINQKDFSSEEKLINAIFG